MSIMAPQKAFHRLSAALTVVLSDGKSQYVAKTKNLSDTGLCLQPKELFPVGTQLQLVLDQPPELPRLAMEGTVRWSEHGKGVGVQFTSIHPHEYRALLKFLSSTSLDRQV
jgi:Tfp pilus assembly protein PilZ